MLKLFKMLKKQALTLAELLIVFVIMGIVASMTLITAKPLDTSLKYVYYRIYNTLGIAFYNASINIPEYFRTGGAHADDMVGRYPVTSEAFCLMLLDFMNDKSGGYDEATGTAANCAADTVNINMGGSAFDTYINQKNSDGSFVHPPHFVASNGSKFWIAHSNTPNTFSTFKFHASNEMDASVDTQIRGYIVVVDLNGDATPNTTQWKENKVADVVAFVVTEDFSVIPLGYPEVDRRYVSASIVYNTTSGVGIEDANTSVSMPYYQAKRISWGTAPGASNAYVTTDEPMSINYYAEKNGFGDKNDNITAKSVFYIDYSTNPQFTEYNNMYFAQEYDEYNYHKNCAKESDPSQLQADACYINIKDYN